MQGEEAGLAWEAAAEEREAARSASAPDKVSDTTGAVGGAGPLDAAV